MKYSVIIIALGLIIPDLAIAQTVIATSEEGSAGINKVNKTNQLPIQAAQVTTTVTNSTVATANTFQTALAANSARKGCRITNKGTATLLVYVGSTGSATAAKSVILAAGTATADGGSLDCGGSQGIVITDDISVTSATVGQAYNVMSQ
jgi:hypothetical protein